VIYYGTGPLLTHKVKNEFLANENFHTLQNTWSNVHNFVKKVQTHKFAPCVHQVKLEKNKIDRLY
ncbi:MAG: hypothetical protein P1S60_19280, partial [Anaerolineae bacterium]|nr:hypothetical protein [Anaerolineae bacterium]